MLHQFVRRVVSLCRVRRGRTSPPSRRRRLQLERLEERLAPAFGTPLLNFDGIGANGVAPPDPVGDVGLNHYIQATNAPGSSVISVYNKNTGAPIAGFVNRPMNTLVTPNPPDGSGDPIVIYDHLANRWLLCEFSGAANATLDFYVSQTSDPTGTWFLYTMDSTGFPDYPKVTVWEDAYYMGTNEGDNPVYALPRSQMLAGTGGTITPIRFSTPDRPNWQRNHIMPADLDGPTAAPAGSPGIFVRQIDDEYTAPGSNDVVNDFLEVWEFHADFVTPANSTYTLATTIAIADFDYNLADEIGRADIEQPGTTIELDALPHYIMWRLQYRNFGGYQTLVGNFTADVNEDATPDPDGGTATEIAGVRWFELRKVGAGAWTRYQEGTVPFADQNHRWMGSIAMNGAGDIALGYSISSSTVNPGLRYIGRKAGDPLGTMTDGEHILVNGGGYADTFNRWGDYHAMSVDPVDDTTFWFVGMYGRADHGWQTRIGKLAGLNQPPIGVSAGGPYTLVEGGSLTLSGSATDPDGDPLTYSWDVNGDGSFGDTTGQNPTLTWAQLIGLGINDGPRTINTLKVRVNDGFGNVVTSPAATLTVTNRAPTANLNNNGPVNEGGNVTVIFSSQLDPSPADTLAGFRYSYDFNNDGVFEVGNGTYAGSVTQSTQAVPTQFLDGTSVPTTVRARILDKDGGFFDLFTDIIVSNVDPTATLGNSGPVGENSPTGTVTFANQNDPALADRNAGFRYSYDFNDDGVYEVGNGTSYAGSVAAASQVIPSSFIPEGPASLIVRGRIFDKDGGFTQYTTTVVIGNVNPTATFANNGPVPEASLSATIAFSNFFDPSGADTTAGFRFSYDFNDDGIYEVGDGATYGGSVTATSQIVTGSFLNDGNLTRRVRARIFDKDGGFTQYVTDIVVSNVAPTADLGNSGEAPEGSTGSSVSFSNQADVSAADVTAGFRYSYDFNNDGTFEVGNGTYAGSTTSASVAVPGTFLTDGPGFARIRARILDKDGGLRDYTTDISLTNEPPVASAPLTNSPGTEGILSFFNLGSFTDPGNDNPWAVTVNWGDSQSESFNVTTRGTLPSRLHRYADNGTYLVQVTVDDNDGGTNATSFNVSVNNAPPVVSPAGTQVSKERTVETFSLGSFFDQGTLDAAWQVRINWGDSLPVDTFNVNAQGALPTFDHTFRRDGTSNVMVFVKDKDGGESSATFQVIVENIDRVIVGTDAGTPPRIQVFDSATNELLSEFNPFLDLPAYTGGVRVASGDINGDGFVDYILGTGPGTQTQVRIYDGLTQTLLDSFDPFGTSFVGKSQGVYVATGDVNSDGRLDIIVGAGGLSRTVKVFKYATGPFFNPLTRTQFDSFDPFPGTAKVDGVTVAVADIDGDGREDIICGTGPGSTAKVVVYRYSTPGANTPRVKIADIRPFETTFKRGVFVAAADLNGNGKAEIIVGPGTTSGRVTQDGPNGGRNIVPRVRVFSSLGTTWFFTQFQPLPSNYDTGVRVGVLPDGGFGRILTASGHSVPGKASKFDGRTLQLIDDVFSDAGNRGFWIVGSR